MWYKEGKPCKVVMTRNDVFPWIGGPTFEAVLWASPYDTGDTYKLIVDGMRISLNPNCSDFVAIVQDEGE